MANDIKLIITADDYGISKAVDDGIIKGIEAGVINTVTVLMNFRRSKTALKRLIKVLADKGLLKKVGVGLHLNITTGEPISKSGIPSLVKVKRRGMDIREFYQFNEIKDKNKKDFKQNEIIIELSAQIQKFLLTIDETGHKLPLDHFTSQHNVLHTIRQFSNILVTLSNTFKSRGKHPQFPIPVRRPLPMMMEMKKNGHLKDAIKELSKETKAYVVKKNVSVESFIYVATWMQKKKLLKINKEVFAKNKIPTPHIMYFCFFGSKKLNQKVFNLQKNLGRIRKAAIQEKNIKRDQTLYIEIVHHLGVKPTEAQIKETKKISGFDMTYFKKFRPTEVQLVHSQEYQNLLAVPGVSHGLYSDLILNPGVA